MNFKRGDDYMTHQLLKYFAYEHLPESLQQISKPISELAKKIDETLTDSAEKTVGLRKLLEAKDCLVRAKLDEPKIERQLNWICPSCCMGFDVMPEKCPINANGCDDLLAKGK